MSRSSVLVHTRDMRRVTALVHTRDVGWVTALVHTRDVGWVTDLIHARDMGWITHPINCGYMGRVADLVCPVSQAGRLGVPGIFLRERPHLHFVHLSHGGGRAAKIPGQIGR